MCGVPERTIEAPQADAGISALESPGDSVEGLAWKGSWERGEEVSDLTPVLVGSLVARVGAVQGVNW